MYLKGGCYEGMLSWLIAIRVGFDSWGRLLGILGGVVCGFVREGGGDDKNVKFEYGKTLAWSCGAKAWV